VTYNCYVRGRMPLEQLGLNVLLRDILVSRSGFEPGSPSHASHPLCHHHPSQIFSIENLHWQIHSMIECVQRKPWFLGNVFFFSLSLSFLQIKSFLNISCPYIYSFIKQDNVKLDGHGFILWLIKWLPLLQIPDNPKSYVTLLWIFCCI